jgi:hypothetical protein
MLPRADLQVERLPDRGGPQTAAAAGGCAQAAWHRSGSGASGWGGVWGGGRRMCSRRLAGCGPALLRPRVQAWCPTWRRARSAGAPSPPSPGRPAGGTVARPQAEGAVGNVAAVTAASCPAAAWEFRRTGSASWAGCQPHAVLLLHGVPCPATRPSVRRKPWAAAAGRRGHQIDRHAQTAESTTRARTSTRAFTRFSTTCSDSPPLVASLPCGAA